MPVGAYTAELDPWMSPPTEAEGGEQSHTEKMKEFDAFQKWVQNTQGWMASRAYLWWNYQNSDLYKSWVSSNKPTGEGEEAGQLKPEGTYKSFEYIVTNPKFTLELKEQLIKSMYPERLDEFYDILALPGYEIPYKKTPLEEALDPYKTPTEEGELGGFGQPPFPTEPPPPGYEWVLDKDYNEWVPSYVGAAGEGPTTYPAPGAAPTDPYGRTAVWSERLGQWDYPPNWGVDPSTMAGGYIPPSREPTTYEPFGRDPYDGGQFNPYTGQWEQPPGYVSPMQQAEMDYMMWQRGQAEREYAAQLRAQGPGSWLEYSSYTGQPPVIQPWMLPLMPQQYSDLTAGQPIPDWQGGVSQPTSGWQGVPQPIPTTTGQGFPYTQAEIAAKMAAAPKLMMGSPEAAAWTAAQEGKAGLTEYGYWAKMQALLSGHYANNPEREAEVRAQLGLPPQTTAQPTTTPTAPGQPQPTAPGGLPALTSPSRQYQARMGPTALQQYGGYQQYRTGATPEETQWRLWSMAPPGGTYRGLSYAR